MARHCRAFILILLQRYQAFCASLAFNCSIKTLLFVQEPAQQIGEL